ncbi:MAG TPA: alpha/beta hydrolase [Thermoanaerobaculia bacterium]|nr:alpha/beta hydrolase [Thermoanaerobaculia bacterium]
MAGRRPLLPWLGVATAVAGACLVVSCGGDAALARFPPWLERCAPPQGVAGPMLCGSYSVPEDRSAPSGRRLDLRVVVLPATGDRLPEPVWFLDGGPGAAATEAVADIATVLAPLRARRDLVFVDQRGTGRSGSLDCAEPSLDGPLQSFFEDFLPVERVRECRERLERVADLRLYTTPIAIDDFEEVRRALGYERVILFGISYGTRAALVYLRRHPESVVAAALKGVAPVDMRNPLPFSRALDRTIGAILDACVADRACRAAHPDPHDDWATVRAAFGGGTVEALVTHPRTGEQERVRLSRGVFADGLRHLLYQVAGAAELPALLRAAAGDDFSPFAERELAQRAGLDFLLADGVFLTVTCSEDLRFVTEADIERETADTFLADYRVRRQLAACAVWPPGDVIGEPLLEPVRADVPVLLLSGELDPATPPDGAERTARELPRSRHLVMPSSSHGFSPGGCERRLLVEFLETGSLEGLDLSCIERARLPRFETGNARRR